MHNSTLMINIHRCFHRIPFILPDTKFFDFIRESWDVTPSSIGVGMGMGASVYHGVDHWIDSENDWQQLQQRISPNQYLQIR